MTPTPAGTIVVTSYENGRFLAAAIQSALAQDIPVDVVVVDDGSTDGSLELLNSFDGDVTVVRKPNGGQASAWNAALPYLVGETVVFLDGDDLLRPDAVRRAARALAGGAVKAHGYLEVVGVSNERVGPPVPRMPLDDGDLSAVLRAHGPGVLGWPPTTGNAWRRELLQQLLPMPEEAFRTSPDLYLCSAAATQGRVAAIEGIVGAWRWHADNSSRRDDLRVRTDDECARWDQVFPMVADLLGGWEDDRERVSAIDVWRRETWAFRLREALDQLDLLLPPDSKFLLLDQDEWAAGSELLGRTRMHLIATSDGSYGGPPPDAARAHEAIRQARRNGAAFLVTAWTAEWWWDYFALESAGPVVHRDRQVVVQQLNEP